MAASVLSAWFCQNRHYGFLSNRRRAAALASCRELLPQPVAPRIPPHSLGAAAIRRGASLPAYHTGKLHAPRWFSTAELVARIDSAKPRPCDRRWHYRAAHDAQRPPSDSLVAPLQAHSASHLIVNPQFRKQYGRSNRDGRSRGRLSTSRRIVDAPTLHILAAIGGSAAGPLTIGP
jgi:hypothetical protein